MNDASQPKLDRFLTARVKEDPMQIDSPPTNTVLQEANSKITTNVNVSKLLGTFRQQSLIPSIAIANAQRRFLHV